MKDCPWKLPTAASAPKTAASAQPLAQQSTILTFGADGSFDIVKLAKYDRLKDKKKIYKTKTGLDAYVPGFDPDAPEPKNGNYFDGYF